jgi:RNase H-fold protein (predicted Holliday junction resolvase)
MRSLIKILTILLMLLLFACAGPRAPEWTLGKSVLYPSEAYLLGVGFGRDRAHAEDRARSEIAKTFQVQIQSRESIVESHWVSQVGEPATTEYSQSVQAELTAITDKVLEGVRIAEIWQDEETGEHYALAVLDRLRTSRALRGELDEIDQAVAAKVRQAEAAGTPLRQLGYYLQALKSLERRRGIAADLRVTDPGGWVLEAPYSLADIAERTDKAAAGIRIGIDLEGDRQGIVNGALVRALTGIGMALAPSLERDLLVKGAVNVELYRTEEPWQWSVASAQVQFVEEDGTVLDALRTSVKEGSRIAARSETIARERLGEKLAALLVARIGSLGAAK